MDLAKVEPLLPDQVAVEVDVGMRVLPNQFPADSETRLERREARPLLPRRRIDVFRLEPVSCEVGRAQGQEGRESTRFAIAC